MTNDNKMANVLFNKKAAFSLGTCKAAWRIDCVTKFIRC